MMAVDAPPALHRDVLSSIAQRLTSAEDLQSFLLASKLLREAALAAVQKLSPANQVALEGGSASRQALRRAAWRAASAAVLSARSRRSLCPRAAPARAPSYLPCIPTRTPVCAPSQSKRKSALSHACHGIARRFSHASNISLHRLQTVTAADLRALRAYPRLATLSLAGHSALQDAHLLGGLRSMPSLTSLDLRGCSKVRLRAAPARPHPAAACTHTPAPNLVQPARRSRGRACAAPHR